jgi:FkbM family methyltransferase
MNNLSLTELLNELPKISHFHSRETFTYRVFSKIARELVEESDLLDAVNGSVELGPFGKIYLPYLKMGNIDTLNLFDLDELIIFSFYWKNRSRYKRVADLGANIGLHSILMSKCGWSPTSYEPDPNHLSLISKNLELNGVTNVKVEECAVSTRSGVTEFTRVLGNTTSSHIRGAKKSPYGDLEHFEVSLKPFNEIISAVDFIKMDVEGEEANIILSTKTEDWGGKEMMLEVGTKENAEAIYSHLSKCGVGMYSQKNNWQQVVGIEDMPTSYKEGSLFLTNLRAGPWVG